MKLKIYLAGPLSGLDADEAMSHFEMRKILLERIYSVLSPFYCKPYLQGSGTLKAGGYKSPVSQDRAIFQRDSWMVRQADMIWADFTHSNRVSIGTCFEIAWAYELGKKVIISGVSPDSEHDHAFLREASTLWFDTSEEAIDYLRTFADQMS